MFEVRPFRALRFNPKRAGSLDDVITPPFDVISPDQRTDLAGRSPHNMVHVILPQDEGDRSRYALAAECYQEWLAKDVLRRDPADHYYILEQRFRDMNGTEHVRQVLYGLARIPEDGEPLVLGHERTFRHKIDDRLSLLRATRVQPGAVFVLYHDEQRTLAPVFDDAKSTAPLMQVTTIDGVQQTFWQASAADAVAQFFADKHVYIGDGHHRFATAKAYRDECRNAKVTGDGYEYVLFGFVAFEDPGLLVYPAHRLIDAEHAPDADEVKAKLGDHFDFRPVEGNLVDAFASADGAATFGLAMQNGERYLVSMKDVNRQELLGDDHGPAWRDLDVAVLHRGIFENLLGLPPDAELSYEPDPRAALARCDAERCGMTWLMKPATPAQIQACADAGEFMPQKATYLYPKLPTGGVMYKLD